MADLDGDADLDLFSGSITGRMFWFPRGAGGGFGARRTLGTRRGEPLYVRADLERRATAVAVGDWDADGDQDLVVGNIEGWVFWIENEGSAREYEFSRPVRLEAGGAEIAVGADAGPALGDWDGDGDLDLLVGAGDGSVRLFRNRGTRSRPRLDEPELLLSTAPGMDDDDTARVRSGMRAPGSRTKPCVADWNGDGLADLLIGDFQLELHPEPSLTDSERDRLQRDRMAYEGALAAYAELGIHKPRQRVMELESPVDNESPKQRALREAELAEARRALAEKSAEIVPLQARLDAARARLPRETTSHGYVWLFLRRAAPPTR